MDKNGLLSLTNSQYSNRKKFLSAPMWKNAVGNLVAILKFTRGGQVDKSVNKFSSSCEDKRNKRDEYY